MVTRAGLRPDRLLLVGGFGDSPYLQLRLESHYGARHSLVHSQQPNAARAATPPAAPASCKCGALTSWPPRRQLHG